MSEETGPGPEDETPEPAAAPAEDPPARRRVWGGRVRRLLLAGLAVGVVLPVAATAVLRFVPPPPNVLMIQRAIEGRGLDYRWRGLSRISPNLVRAVIAAEDARFCGHFGFDLEAIEKAMQNNARRPGRIRGGSTISQQTAKNVFLWPQRSYVRKGLEAYFTVLIEALWGKRRIMEVYLNVAEMGPGTYGAEAAARRYFRKSAADLTVNEAARLAAILPSPLRYRAAQPGPYVRGRAARISANMGTVRADRMDACVIRRV